AQDAGVVDDAVDAPEGLDRRLDDAFGRERIGDAMAVGRRRAPGLGDLRDDLLRDARVAALAIRRAAEIVDHHLGALRRGEQRDLAPDAAPRAVEDDAFAFKAPLAHLAPPIGSNLETPRAPRDGGEPGRAAARPPHAP